MPDYFTVAELRALPQMADTETYTTARIEAVAAYVTAIIDREVFGTSGVGFVSRPLTMTLDGNGLDSLLLPTPYVLSLTTVTLGGVSVSTTGLLSSAGVLRYPLSGGSWTAGRGNVVITYQGGYSSTPPADIKEAALQATRWRLLATNSNAEISARQTSLTNDVGATIQFAVAGADRPTGYPEVDAVIVGWRDRLSSFGFA